SYISFTLGKIFGYRLVSWIVGKENTDKYSEILRKRGGFFLALAFLLPMFPDDILCFIAGITKMSPKTFFWITLITRPVGVICMSFFGSGYVIPFSGWGIYVWIAILILAVVLVWVVYKWQDNIQNYILDKIFKNSKKKTNKSKNQS
ncbi:MAG: TVP38/TMEM64 family protein, partial [Christensenellales bacterium]